MFQERVNVQNFVSKKKQFSSRTGYAYNREQNEKSRELTLLNLTMPKSEQVSDNSESIPADLVRVEIRSLLL